MTPVEKELDTSDGARRALPSKRSAEERIAAIRHAATYAFPVADIDQMLEEIGDTAPVGGHSTGPAAKWHAGKRSLLRYFVEPTRPGRMRRFGRSSFVSLKCGFSGSTSAAAPNDAFVRSGSGVP